MSGVPNIRRRPRPGSADKPADIESASDNAKAAGDYEVGYRKPPVDTRFGGPRGNRSGRKKGSRSRGTIISDELDARVDVPGHGRLSKFQLGIRQLVNQAAKGDLKAITAVLRLGLEQERERKAAEQLAPTEPVFDDHDRSVMDILMDLAGEAAALRGAQAEKANND